MARQKYTPEFRTEAVRLCEAGDRNCAQVAQDLGVGYPTLMSWVRAAKAASLLDGSLKLSEREELKLLRKENVRLRQERDILKKATAFFASQKP